MSLLKNFFKLLPRDRKPVRIHKYTTYTKEIIFTEDGWYKIKDEYEEGNPMINLCKVEEGEERAKQEAAAMLKISFERYAMNYLQSPK